MTTRRVVQPSALAVVWLLLAVPRLVPAQLSPPAQTRATVSGATLTVKYSAPSVRGRRIFGLGGVLSQDATYPVWRAGADAATSFTTNADVDIGGLKVPKGSYTLFVLVQDPDAWQLIVNKQTGQSGLEYDQRLDLGRVKMDMSKPAALVEVFRITLANEGGNKGRLTMEWENHIASLPITVQ